MRKALAILAFFGLCLPAIARADVPIQRASGSLTALNQTVTVNPLIGATSCVVLLSGTYTATVTSEGSVDGTNYAPIPMTGITNNGGALPANSSTGTFMVQVGSLSSFRVRISAYTSGTVNAFVQCSGSAASSGGAVSLYGQDQFFGGAYPLFSDSDVLRAHVSKSNGAYAPIVQCDQSAVISVNTAATTQLIALASSKVIYVCSFNVIAGGATNVTLEYGTGTNCGTGTTALTGAYPLAAQTGLAPGNGLGAILRTPASQALCIVNSAAIQVSGFLTYGQY